MQQVNSKWNVWITASLYDFFKNNINPYPVFFDGVQDNSKKELNWIDMSIDGPRFERQPSNKWVVKLGIFFYCNSVQNISDLYQCQKIMGRVHESLASTLNIYKCGHNDDDNSFFMCLHLDKSGVQSQYFGLTNIDQDLHAGLIITRYEGSI